MKEVRNLQQKYVDGQINRRDFIKAVGALGIAVTAAGSLLKATEAMAKTPRKEDPSEWLPTFTDLMIRWIPSL